MKRSLAKELAAINARHNRDWHREIGRFYRLRMMPEPISRTVKDGFLAYARDQLQPRTSVALAAAWIRWKAKVRE